MGNCHSSTRIICIEGNIGSGKTTQLTLLATNKDNIVFCEPVDTHWKLGLQKLYSDPTKYFVSFQTQVRNWFEYYIPTLIKQHRGIYKNIIIERSVRTSIEVFSKVGLKNQIIDEYQYSMLKLNLEYMVPDLIIYINTPYDICMKRIKSRNRKCEMNSIYKLLAIFTRLSYTNDK